MGYYKRGEHLDAPALAKYVIYRRVTRIEVESPDEDFGYALDGEMRPSRKFSLSVVPAALRFAIPRAAAEYIATRAKSRAKATATT